MKGELGIDRGSGRTIACAILMRGIKGLGMGRRAVSRAVSQSLIGAL